MMKEKYESLSAAELKAVAKARGLKHLSGLKKSEVVARMLEADEKEKAEKENSEKEKAEVTVERAEKGTEKAEPEKNTPESVPENNAKPATDLSQLDSGLTVEGILEVMPDGYGFIRSDNYLPGENDIYVSPSQIRRFNLKTGDIIKGNTRIKTQQEKFAALLYLKSTNGMHPAEAEKRCNFEDMTPIFPNKRMRMERDPRNVAMRIVDLISPVGKGQRGMIVSQPKAGKTTLLKEMAKSILHNDPNMHLIILLIDLKEMQR